MQITKTSYTLSYSDGRVWMDDTNRHARMKLYKKEGIEIDAKGRIKNFQDILFEF